MLKQKIEVGGKSIWRRSARPGREFNDLITEVSCLRMRGAGGGAGGLGWSAREGGGGAPGISPATTGERLDKGAFVPWKCCKYESMKEDSGASGCGFDSRALCVASLLVWAGLLARC